MTLHAFKLTSTSRLAPVRRAPAGAGRLREALAATAARLDGNGGVRPIWSAPSRARAGHRSLTVACATASRVTREEGAV